MVQLLQQKSDSHFSLFYLFRPNQGSLRFAFASIYPQSPNLHLDLMIKQVCFVPVPLLVLWGCRFGIHQSMSQRAHVPDLSHLLH